MSGKELMFTIPGECPPEGSFKAFPYKGKDGRMHVNQTHQNSKAINEFRKLTKTVMKGMHQEFFVSDTDISYQIDIVFYKKKPKSVKRDFPSVRGTGDLDKLTRALLDAITYDEAKNKEGIIPDDSTIIGINAWKLYTEGDEPSKTVVRITKITDKSVSGIPFSEQTW